jgi:hypothetical protein
MNEIIKPEKLTTEIAEFAKLFFGDNMLSGESIDEMGDPETANYYTFDFNDPQSEAVFNALHEAYDLSLKSLKAES